MFLFQSKRSSTTFPVKTFSHQPLDLEFLHGAGNDSPHFPVHLTWGTPHNQVADGSSGDTDAFVTAHDGNLRASQNDAGFCLVFNGELYFTSVTCSVEKYLLFYYKLCLNYILINLKKLFFF